MKRLLAYLFIVLGLGLTFSVSANSDDLKHKFCGPNGLGGFYLKTYINDRYGECFPHKEVSSDKYILYKLLENTKKLQKDNPTKYKSQQEAFNSELKIMLKDFEYKRINSKKIINTIEDNWKLDKFYNKYKTQIAKVEPSQTQKVAKKNDQLSSADAWFTTVKLLNSTKTFKATSRYKQASINEAMKKCKNFVAQGIGQLDFDFKDCSLLSIKNPDAIYFVKLLSKGSDISSFNLSDSDYKKVISLKIHTEEVELSNKLDTYLALLQKGKKLDKYHLEKTTINKITQIKINIEEANLLKYVAVLHSGKKLNKFYLEKETIPKVIKLKLKTEEDNISKYLKADLKSEDLTKFNIEKETIALIKVKRQERKETLYAKTCTGWVFGHKKGTYEWFKCLEDEEQKELFGETKIVKNIKTKPSKTEKVIKTTSSDNEPPILNVVEALTVTDPRYTIEGKVTDKGSDKIYLKVDGQDVLINKGKFVINRYSPVDETIKITAIDKWGNEVTKMIKVSVNIENSSVAEVLEPLNASKIKSKSSNNKVALIIGIEQYEQSPKASYANLDAKYFFDYARKAFGVKKNNIKMLIDQEASLSKTNSAIFKWLPGKIKANETDLIIFFSGHGLASNDGKEKYILPSNADPDLLSRTALSRSELFDEIVKLNPKSVTMFFDTCYSGVSRDEKTLLASAKPLRIVANDDKEIPDNFTIFTASKGDQISSGLKEAKHGIFSYYLMKGLEGKADANKDKDITNGELRAYMVKNVSDKALDLGRQQTPVLSGDPDKILMSYR
jgi:hypothetical protein